jgi:hypothetical protein
MTARLTRSAIFIVGGLIIAMLYFFFYDKVQKLPRPLHPPLLLFICVATHVAVNLVTFTWNGVKALSSMRRKHDKRSEENAELALRGLVTDERILQIVDPAVFLTLGAAAASGVIWLVWLLK